MCITRSIDKLKLMSRWASPSADLSLAAANPVLVRTSSFLISLSGSGTTLGSTTVWTWKTTCSLMYPDPPNRNGLTRGDTTARLLLVFPAKFREQIFAIGKRQNEANFDMWVVCVLPECCTSEPIPTNKYFDDHVGYIG